MACRIACSPFKTAAGPALEISKSTLVTVGKGDDRAAAAVRRSSAGRLLCTPSAACIRQVRPDSGTDGGGWMGSNWRRTLRPGRASGCRSAVYINHDKFWYGGWGLVATSAAARGRSVGRASRPKPRREAGAAIRSTASPDRERSWTCLGRGASLPPADLSTALRPGYVWALGPIREDRYGKGAELAPATDGSPQPTGPGAGPAKVSLRLRMPG
mmetsp:Transcript_67260/g.112617  ORF Transcript_67260/g.112617 Transcript_67260/m.112617 type:complete len:214 (+) Transcript_67260:3866-4507(+)